ncbi:MAG: large subunit ribosomal protein [Solirubrobacteraceae bacterium]|jgi:large subunit ribosomal protein L25|nr:large subunit ribosomal protein [Solirubrobacteraceae bacterium]
MAGSETTALNAAPREAHGSRETRRLRRTGQVPGVVYGGDGESVALQVESRTLRRALAHSGAVLELALAGEETPVVLKDVQRHPVTGETMHVDFLRVRLDQAIQTTVVLELLGIEEAPGVKDGGIVEQITRELTVEALPNDIPDRLEHDVSGMEMNDTLTLEAVKAPAGVTLVDDSETVVATLTPPRLEIEPEEEIEQETELVGEGEEEGAAEGDAEGAGDSDAAETETPEG